MSQAQEVNKLPIILTAIITVIATVAVLHLYGYLNFVNPEKGLELADYRVVTVGSEEAGSLRRNPAKHEAECVDGILVCLRGTHSVRGRHWSGGEAFRHGS